MSNTTVTLKRFQVRNAITALNELLDGPYHLLHTPKLVLAATALEPVAQGVHIARKLLVASYATMVDGDPDKGERATPLLNEKGDVEFGDDEDGRIRRGKCQTALEDFDNEEIAVEFPLAACKMHNADLKAKGSVAFALRFMVDSTPKAVVPKKAVKP